MLYLNLLIEGEVQGEEDEHEVQTVDEPLDRLQEFLFQLVPGEK